MKISAKAEYACLAMLDLAANYDRGEPVRLKAISEAQGIPHQRFLVQILLQLKTAGLVASVRGAAGGYQLTRSPERISLAEIIGAIDDRSFAWRSALNDETPSAATETLLGVWKELQGEAQRALARLTLAELLRRTRETNALSYQI